MLRRTLAIVLLALAVVACGDDDDPTAAETTTTTADRPAWLAELADEGLDLERREVDGTEVWVDEEARRIYVEDCADTEALAERDGAPFAGRDGEIGYSSVCPNGLDD